MTTKKMASPNRFRALLVGNQTKAPATAKFCSVGEKLATNQVYQHMEDNGLFSSGQSAYLRLHSTVTHLLKNTDDWYNGLDLGKLVGLVFIDLKKLLTLLTMRFFAKNWCITVSNSGNSHGLNHT